MLFRSEGLITAGAMLDVTLGLVLLERSGAWRGAGRRMPLTVGGAAILGFLAIGAAVDFNPNTITSGVFRRGDFEGHTAWRSLFYQDGRTSTVSAHIGTSDGVVVLATNGKPDATLGPRWIGERVDSPDILPIPQGRDFTTQILGPILALGHRPQAQTAAIIGHGSGMSATSLLTSERIERLVTILDQGSAPAAAGYVRLWYDSTNGVIRTSNGTVWRYVASLPKFASAAARDTYFGATQIGRPHV